FLPDKAIDLVDEAASRLRIEIDSMPQEIDEVERKILQLEIQRQALLKEKDKAGVERREAVEKEIAELKEKSGGMKAQWQAEKEAVQKVRKLREEVEQTKLAIEQAERSYDLNRAAELKYGKMLELLHQRGIEKPAWITPHEFAATMKDPRAAALVGEFTTTYNSLRFGNDHAAAPRLVALLDELRKSLLARRG
ncbi:MAG: DUF4129 domain-containing protein, partial [Bdellovibrionales bacterium]|nr:DUF4129 domain-containing protein [Bdellovibrionales bacterium]